MQKLSILLSVFIIIGCRVQKAIPKEEGGFYRIEISNSILEIDPQTGGRITSMKLEGRNFFTGKDVHAKYWGSSLWPSPQKEWGGTLPPELDEQPYSVRVENKVIKMVSRKDSKFGYVFSKEIYGDSKNNSFNIKYTIINRSDSVRTVAPWEVTRVHTKGFAFYPKGTGNRWGNMAGLAEDKDGITWFVYDENKIPAKHNKFFADGSEGWIAQVNEDLIFIKKFLNISAEKAAPGESEVEVYADPNKLYVEIEQQGEYRVLQPGDSLVWEVKWFLRKIPADIPREAGSQSLVSYVREIVK
ncbi:MAG TPA: DUF4380 domain-containing protein [Flavitalea sp.]|nr:DUF4380 domain-containing protein [Flavitalea sp.]